MHNSTVSDEQDTAMSQTETQMSKGKRVVKLTARAVAEQLERMQNVRKTKLNMAGNLRETIKGLMEMGDVAKFFEWFS